MGRRYPPLNRSQIIEILKAHDFAPKKREGGGTSHEQWEGYVKGQRRLVTVKKLPRDTDVYGSALLKSMIDQSGLTKKEFYAILGY
jgi:hypothetical protein